MAAAETIERQFAVGERFRTTGHRLAWAWPDEFEIAEELEPDHLAPHIPKVRLEPSELTDANLTRGEDDIQHALSEGVIRRTNCPECRCHLLGSWDSRTPYSQYCPACDYDNRDVRE